MSVHIEQWRAAIGRWSGGRLWCCVKLQNCISETSNNISYKQIRFVLLLSLLVIGCVELNPGPDRQPSATSKSYTAALKFSRRPGTDGLHGMMYEKKMAGFLFARAVHRTADFCLASNVDGFGAFDDLVFRYRLKGSDVWKTCFIQLKHKEKEGTIQLSSLIKLSGDFSLFKYFASYCQIKSHASTEQNLIHWGPFDDFEFVIYTNAKMEINSAFQVEVSDPLVILTSDTDCGQYITFAEAVETKVFKFFEELSECRGLLVELNNLIASGTFVCTDFDRRIESFTNISIKTKLRNLKSNLNKDCVTGLISELAKCDFTLYQEFLSKVKIFHKQSNEKSLNGLIEKELDDICKTSPSLSKSIYTKFEEGFSKWWEEVEDVDWLSKNSEVWQDVVKHIFTEISEPNLLKFVPCGIRFNEQQIQRLCDAIKHSTFLNIVTNCDIRYLQHLKTYQTLNKLGYTNLLFIGLESLRKLPKEILKLWHSKWSAALVIDCDCDGNVADILLGILLQCVGCEQGLAISDGNMVETLVAVLQKYEQKVVLISTRQHINLASPIQNKLQNIHSAYEDNCDVSEFDAESQRQILQRTVNFQGINVTLDTLVGTDRLECIKPLVDSEVISMLLSNEHKLCVGRQLSGLPKYYVPRVLQHHIYLKEDILKQTQNTTAYAVSGLQAEELKKKLPVGEKIYEFVYNIHSFKIVSDLSTTGLSTELDNMKSYNHILGENSSVHNSSESLKPITSTFADYFSKSGLSAGLGNEKAINKLQQKIKLEEVRYIILGNENPESRFRELKALLPNVHWIHVEETSFLWRDSKCNLDIIRRYTDKADYKNYTIDWVMEQSDRTMLLVAEPGMGKSTFLSHMEREIKKRNKEVWVLRINLNEHTQLLDKTEFEEGRIDKCKMFLWEAACAPEQCATSFVQKIFLQALEQTGKMVIILDGFDEISPNYTSKVNNLIRAIRDKMASQIFVSSRFSYRQNLEDILIKLAFTLQPFSRENQIEFLKQYWSKDNQISKQENMCTFAEELLSLYSENLSDKCGEFTCIPLQIMMLGEAFVTEATEYCTNGELKLPEKFDLLDLFNKFWEKKCEIYFREKNEMDISKPKVKRDIESYFRYHMIAALMSLFPLSEENGLLGAINDCDLQQAKGFLESGLAEQFGMIREMTDEKPWFIHRCFAEYFAAKWFAGNFTKCKDFISDNLFNSTYEVTRNIFDRMLAKDFEIHGAVLNNDIMAVEEILKVETDINKIDKGGRTALHLAASYNSPVIQTLLTHPGDKTNIPDEVLNWTPLQYAYRSKSWMAMDILLQNCANPDDIVFNRPNSESQDCEKEALLECASKGHRKLLEFMLNCGTEVNAVLECSQHSIGKGTLLHIAAFNCQLEIIGLLVERGADINTRNSKNETALHLAAISGSMEIINMLPDTGIPVDLKDEIDWTALHHSSKYGNLESTKALVEREAAINKASKDGETPLHLAAIFGKLEIFCYLIEKGADINIRGVQNTTALHCAAFSDSVEIINILLDKGMSVDLTDEDDWTPLHYSAQYGNLEATKRLVERGAAINKASKDGETPLHLAAESGKLEVFCYLTAKGADINIRGVQSTTALHCAAVFGSVEIINILLDKGMSVDLTDEDDWTPLHESANNGQMEATKTLVERGAALDSITNKGDTPLHLAARNRKSEIFHYLTERGANINVRGYEGRTVLHDAAISGSVEIIKILLDKGMFVNLTDKNDWTPLHYSANYGHMEATKTLVESGAALDNITKDGKTPLHLAKVNGQLEVFHYLKEMQSH